MPRQRKALTNLSQQVAEKYYTAQEAQKRLGMTRDMFNHHVKQGSIKKNIIVGSHGYYLRKQIDLMAEKIEFDLLTADESVLEFRFATQDDMEALNRMAYLNFGELSRTPERMNARARLLKENPLSTFVLCDYGNVVASIDLIPVTHSAVLAFRNGVRGWQLPNEDIGQFAPGRRLECIIIDLMSTTNAPRGRRGRYASILLMHVRDTLVEWGSKGIDIKSIDACGGFEDGKRLLQHAGFTNLGITPNNREIYTLDIDQSELRPLEPYKQALAKWKSQH